MRPVIRRYQPSWAYLSRDARRALPFGLLLWLWLDPFMLARPGADSPDPFERLAARQHNLRLRRAIPRYVGRWLAIGGASWAGLAAFPGIALVSAGLGVVVGVSLSAAACIAAAGAMLGR